jgi:hypothetical protein
VYDDGDTETVRLEADPSKRRPDDVVFRWLPDAPPVDAAAAAPADDGRVGPQAELAARSPAAASSPPPRSIGLPTAAARSPPSARGAGLSSPQRTPGRGTASPAARLLSSPNVGLEQAVQ